MRQTLHIISFIVLMALTASCTGSSNSGSRAQLPSDTLHTRQLAMSIYGYQPARALQIIDTAFIVGNISELQADQCRARIYSMSRMKEQVDSLLGGPADVRLDSAQAIGERILSHDSIKGNLLLKRDVLEVLAHTARMKNDTTGWLQRSRELVDVCRQIGGAAETDALRSEAEIGAALHALGRHKEGMAKLDSVIATLSEKGIVNSEDFKFNEFDALIIALKRKIMLLTSHDQYAEVLPLANLMLRQIDNYEKNPDAFHDGSSREPKTDVKRADYIQFYRNQALNYMTNAYAVLGESGNLRAAFEMVERGVRDITAREHIARYNALQQQMEAEREHAIANKAKQTSFTVGILALLFLVLAVAMIFHNSSIRRKNHLLAQQIANAVKYKENLRQLNETPDSPNLSSMTDKQLYQYIDDIIIRERLFCDPKFGREAIMKRFKLSKERVGTVFSQGSEHTKMSTYILQLRLEYAAQQLLEQPDKTIVQIASGSGFSSNAYFSNCFRQHFGMTPTDYRREVTK